jgi:NAD+-dependent farnesol dehydrogenase
VVNGHIAALRKGKFGERYLLTGENASFVQIFDMAAAITRTKKPYFHIPLWMIEIYGWILVFFSRITGTLPLISHPVCFNSNPFFIFYKSIPTKKCFTICLTVFCKQ